VVCGGCARYCDTGGGGGALKFGPTTHALVTIEAAMATMDVRWESMLIDLRTGFAGFVPAPGARLFLGIVLHYTDR
jgi:hypothetical protein